MKRFLTAAAAVLFLLAGGAQSARAVGGAATPSELFVRAEVGKETSVRLKVGNPSNEVVLVEVYADVPSSLVSAFPASFTLQAGEEHFVNVRVKARETSRMDTTLSVVARSLAEGPSSAGSGIKVPVHIEAVVSSKAAALLAMMASLYANSHVLIYLGLLFAGLAGGYAFKSFTHRRRS